MRHYRGIVANLCAIAALITPPSIARAETFCERLDAIINTAPRFEALRGAPQGTDYVATTTIAAAPRCMIVHPQGAPGTLGAEWSFRCTWPHVAPESIAWFRQQINTCYPSSSDMFKDVSTLGIANAGGFMWSLAGFTIVYFFDPPSQSGQFIVQGNKGRW